MDRAVDAAAAQQRGIGGVDDRVDRERRDVAFEELDARIRHEGLPRRVDAPPILAPNRSPCGRG
jgi:hypothetical protein